MLATVGKGNPCVSPSDPTLTTQNIAPIMKAVRNWRQLAFYFDIPDAIVARITEQHATHREQSHAAGEWWVHTDLSPSWDRLAHALYHEGEDRALKKMAQYLPKGAYMERILCAVVLIVSVSSSTCCSVRLV